jgi:hypothetical protein
MTFQELPIELLFIIFANLGIDDKLKCRQVCKLFYNCLPLKVEMKYKNINELIQNETNFNIAIKYIYLDYFSKYSFNYLINAIGYALNFKNSKIIQFMINNIYMFRALKTLKIRASSIIKYFQANKEKNIYPFILTLMHVKIDRNNKCFSLLSYKFIYSYYNAIVNSENIKIFKKYVDCNKIKFHKIVP